MIERKEKFSLSEKNGIEELKDKDLQIYSVGISTAGSAEMLMAALQPNRRIIATTLDEEGARLTQNKIQEKGFSNQITIKIEDVKHPLPYLRETFDFIYARLILHYLSNQDLQSALKELFRILKKNGKFFVVVRSTECEEAQSQHSFLNPMTGITTYTNHNGQTYKRFFHSENSIQEFLKHTGFVIEKIQKYKEHLCVDFNRTQFSNFVDTLIEVVAVK